MHQGHASSYVGRHSWCPTGARPAPLPSQPSPMQGRGGGAPLPQQAGQRPPAPGGQQQQQMRMVPPGVSASGAAAQPRPGVRFEASDAAPTPLGAGSVPARATNPGA